MKSMTTIYHPVRTSSHVHHAAANAYLLKEKLVDVNDEIDFKYKQKFLEIK